MPNERVLSEKKRAVEKLTEKLKSQAGVLVNYTGITVNEDTEMRVKMREANIDYSVVKNTLMRFAVKNVGFEALESILIGTTSLAVSKDDPVAPARIVKEYADKFDKYFEIKGGFMDGRVLSVDEVNALAKIPALPILYAQLLGTMLAPVASLAMVLKAVADRDNVAADVEISISEAETAEAPTEAEATAEAPTEAEVTEEAPAETEAAVEAPTETEATAEAPTEAETTEEATVEVKAPAEAEAAVEAPTEAEAVVEAPTESEVPAE